MKQRTFYLDNVCGVLIIHMVYTYHIAKIVGFCDSLSIYYINTILSFFMSWFFFKGGMMHKKTSTREIFRKSFKRLLIPYLIMLILGISIDFIIKYINYKDFHLLDFAKELATEFIANSIVWPTAATWFLLALFFVKITFNIICNKIHPILMILLSAFIAFAIHIMNKNGIGLDLRIPGHDFHLIFPTYYIGAIFHGLSVYSLGFYLREKQFELIIFISATIIVIISSFVPAEMDFRANDTTSNYLLALIYGMSSCIFINNIFKSYFNIRFSFISYIGANSMIFYLFHFPVMYATVSLFWKPFEQSEQWIQFLILSTIVTISLIIANHIFRTKRLRFVVGG